MGNPIAFGEISRIKQSQVKTVVSIKLLSLLPYIPRIWFGAFSDYFGFDFFSVKTKNRFQIYPGTPV